MKKITRLELYNYLLRGKPHCPACNNTLAYVYGDTPQGTYITVKCNRCRSEVLVEIGTLKTTLVEKAV